MASLEIPTRPRPLVVAGLVVALALCGGYVDRAAAQGSAAAVVTHVVDGDTVDALAANGQAVRIRLIGIDAPEFEGVEECAGRAAKDQLERLVEGRNVTVTLDPTQGYFDQYGRLLAYVDRDDGLDVGAEMLRSGWARVYLPGQPFLRLAQYRDAEANARGISGAWVRCNGNFHLSLVEQRRAKRISGVAFVRRYYRRVSNRQFQTAWQMLSRPVRRSIGPFRGWKRGFRRSLGGRLISARARLSGRKLVVSIRLLGGDFDACNGRLVRSRFRGRWVLAPDGDAWVATDVDLRKTRGGRVRLFKSECRPKRPPAAPPTPAPAPPQVDCQGYDPCITPGPDVDCAGGSGNGPRYVSGPVSVTGSDPYGLDGDGDGVACES